MVLDGYYVRFFVEFSPAIRKRINNRLGKYHASLMMAVLSYDGRQDYVSLHAESMSYVRFGNRDGYWIRYPTSDHSDESEEIMNPDTIAVLNALVDPIVSALAEMGRLNIDI